MQILFIALVALALLILVGLIYQGLGTAKDRRRFPPPGRLVDLQGRRFHLVESGQGKPTVILESGISASCLNWTRVLNETARITQAVSYDRASLGWSDRAETPRVLSCVTGELRALLHAAQIDPPYVFVGHSFGGLAVSAYAIKYPQDVAGLILVDPLSAREWLEPSQIQSLRLQRGIRLSRRGALLARLGVVRFSLRLLSGGARRLPQFVARVSSGGGHSTISRIVGQVSKMPPETWPMIQAHWCQPKSFQGMAAHLESLPRSSAEAAALGSLPPVPITILSAATATPAELAEREALAQSSPRGKHILARQSGHWIQLDEPDLVIQTIREMVEQLRAGV